MVRGAELLDCTRKVVHGTAVVGLQVLQICLDLLYQFVVRLDRAVGVDLLESLHDGILAGEFGLAVRLPTWAWLGSGSASTKTTTGGHGCVRERGWGSFGCPARAGGTVKPREGSSGLSGTPVP